MDSIESRIYEQVIAIGVAKAKLRRLCLEYAADSGRFKEGDIVRHVPTSKPASKILKSTDGVVMSSFYDPGSCGIKVTINSRVGVICVHEDNLILLDERETKNSK